VTPRLARWQGTERLEVEVLDLRAARMVETGQAPDIASDSRIP
jgi:hypothetical protein